MVAAFPSVALAENAAPASAVVSDVVPLAASDCPSNYFCIWPSRNYVGTMVKYGVVNSYREVTMATVGSYYNHRVDRSWVFEFGDGSGRSLCVAPGDRSGSVPSWAGDAESVYLSLIVSC